MFSSRVSAALAGVSHTQSRSEAVVAIPAAETHGVRAASRGEGRGVVIDAGEHPEMDARGGRLAATVEELAVRDAGRVAVARLVRGGVLSLRAEVGDHVRLARAGGAHLLELGAISVQVRA